MGLGWMPCTWVGGPAVQPRVALLDEGVVAELQASHRLFGGKTPWPPASMPNHVL